MKLEELIKTGLENKPPRILLYGTHGIGKSRFAAMSPSPIFIPTEDGLTTIDVPRFPLAQSLDNVWEYMGKLISENHQYQTVIMDTIDWLENLIWKEVCKTGQKEKIEDFGYGKGYNNALIYWDKFINGLDKLREKGMAILLIAHSEIKIYNPPDNEPYDRYQIKLHQKAAAKLEEWVDAVLFLHKKVYVDNKKAVEGETVLFTDSCPAWRAKNRYGFPKEIPYNFNNLLTLIKGEKTNG